MTIIKAKMAKVYKQDEIDELHSYRARSVFPSWWFPKRAIGAVAITISLCGVLQIVYDRLLLVRLTTDWTGLRYRTGLVAYSVSHTLPEIGNMSLVFLETDLCGVWSRERRLSGFSAL